MKNICFLISSLCNEGPVNVMYNIIKFMDFSKFNVSIITLIPEKINSRLIDFKELPINIYQINKDKPSNTINLFIKLNKLIHKIKPDIIHSHCPRSLYLMYFLKCRGKKVYTIHIYPGLQQYILYGKLKGQIIINLNNFFSRHIDLAIGCAKSIGELYLKNKGIIIPCVPNGSSLRIWDNNYSQRDLLREKLGLRKDIKYFIYIGRFSAEKNPDFLVHAFDKYEKKNIGIILLGDGPLRENLKSFSNDRIILPGFKKNVYEYLIASDYYISASDVEGLANTILESMTIGLPMLLSNIPSHKEVLDKMSKTVGYIFNNKSKKDLYEKINKICSLNKEEVAQEIQSVYKNNYTAEIMSNSYQNIYLNLCSTQKKI